MFQIKKIYETDLTTILKIEGEIGEQSARDWLKEMHKILNHSERDVILELCDVTFVASKAIEKLIGLLSENIYVLNAATTVRNALQSKGLTANLLT